MIWESYADYLRILRIIWDYLERIRHHVGIIWGHVRRHYWPGSPVVGELVKKGNGTLPRPSPSPPTSTVTSYTVNNQMYILCRRCECVSWLERVGYKMILLRLLQDRTSQTTPSTFQFTYCFPNLRP